MVKLEQPHPRQHLCGDLSTKAGSHKEKRKPGMGWNRVRDRQNVEMTGQGRGWIGNGKKVGIVAATSMES